MDKEEFTSQELIEAKATILGILDGCGGDKDKKDTTYTFKELSNNDLIREVREETEDIGKSCIIMQARSTRRINKREKYKTAMLAYLRGIPESDQNKKCFGYVTPKFSPNELIRAVEGNTPIGREWLEIYISDCEKGDPPQIIELQQGYLPEVFVLPGGGGLNWARIFIISLLTTFIFLILFFLVYNVLTYFGPAPSLS